jgi:tetratricopeptide (TPR) repeat protein
MKELPASENMYVAISRALGNVEMHSESEAVMLRALEVYPNSRYIRFELGKLYVTLNRRDRAIDIFEQASRMVDPSSSPLADAFQRSLISRSLGNAEEALFRFDEAVASYELALEVMPGDVEALVALADLLLRTSEVDGAIERYSEALERDPANAKAHHGLAEGHLRRGRFGEAARQAAIALEKDPLLRKARYVLAMALIRSGKKQEGQEELAAYQQLGAAADEASNARREVAVINRTAAAELKTDPDGAVAAFLEGIRKYPDAALLLQNLGLAQDKLGMHEAALQTFQSMGKAGFGGFLVELNFSREYAALGELPAAERHRVAYLQEYYAFLVANLMN